MTITTETELNVHDRHSKNVAQHVRAGHISVALIKNAKSGICSRCVEERGVITQRSSRGPLTLL